jgi:Flp pilus assembly protein TadD
MTMRSLGVGPVGTLVASGALDKQERLLLTDFDNASGDSTVGETVTELLRIDLAQSRVLSLLEPSQVREVLERMQLDPASRLTPELAQELATREGIKAYVTGEVRSVGAGFVISARLIAAASGDALVTARETANDPSELIPAVDRLSKHMRERVGESLRTLRADPPLERLTTSSLEALRLYTQATAVADRGDYRRAISLLEEAVARDSTFAMAYRRLGMYKTNPSFRFQMGASGDSALRRAYALRNRLADRERYHVEAAYWARAENDLEKAVTTYLALLEKYPDDAVALNNLAVQYTLLGRFAERDATYRQIIDRRIASAITYTNFLGALRDRGALAQADTILELFAERFPSSPEISQYRAGLAGARKQWADVSRIAEEALRSQPEIEVWAHNVLADVSEVQGKLAEARRLREEAVRRNAQRQGWTPEDRDFLIQLEALELQLWYAADRGGYASRVEQAWRRNLQLTAGRAIQDRRYPRFIYNFILAGQPERARQIGREFSAGLDPALRELPFVRNAFREAEAATLAADGRYGEALDLYHAVRRDQPQCAMCGLIELADAYDRAGQVDSALAYYERYFETQGNRLGTDAAWFARSLKRAGELSEGRDQREKAVEYYNRFVELWSNADAELQPLVADARARIARLVGER